MRDNLDHFTLDVTPETLSNVRALFTALAERLALGSDITHKVLIAIDEAVQNVVRHGYRPAELPGRLDVTITREDDELVFELRDYAAPADLAAIRPYPPDLDRPGHFGMHLIRAAMDDVRYSHAPDGNGNVLLMRKRLG